MVRLVKRVPSVLVVSVVPCGGFAPSQMPRSGDTETGGGGAKRNPRTICTSK